MSPAGFEMAIPASVWLHTHALDCVATGIGRILIILPKWDWWEVGLPKMLLDRSAV